MNDEEREALKILKAVGIRCKGINIDEVIINLIKKQQKEIEELKEKIKTFKIEDENIFTIWRNHRKKRWKDKIKAKIEELEKQQKEEPDAYLCIKVLQSLLEKE